MDRKREPQLSVQIRDLGTIDYGLGVSLYALVSGSFIPLNSALALRNGKPPRLATFVLLTHYWFFCRNVCVVPRKQTSSCSFDFHTLVIQTNTLRAVQCPPTIRYNFFGLSTMLSPPLFTIV